MLNVVLQTADSVFVGGTTTNGKGDFLLNKGLCRQLFIGTILCGVSYAIHCIRRN